MKKDMINVRAAVRNTLPIIFAYLFLGATFGLVMNKNGYGWYWSLLSSMFVYSGSMQFVQVGLLTSGASLIQTAIMTFLVNSRHLFYGLSLTEKFSKMGSAKPYMVHALSDETFSLLTSPDIREGEDEKTVMFLTALFDQIYWITGSVIGGLIGNYLPMNIKGIDFSMTALFTVIVTDHVRKKENRIPAVIGLISSVAFLLILGPDSFLLPSLLTSLVILLSWKNMRKSEYKGGAVNG